MKKLRLRILPGAFLTLMILILLAGAAYLGLEGIDEYDRILRDREDQLVETMDLIEPRLSSFHQLVSSAASLAENIPATEKDHEVFLRSLFSSSRTAFVYGIGIWYEPDMFEPGRTRYGPYIRFDNPAGGPFSVTYEWNSPEYNYPGTDWYRYLFNATGDEIRITKPYFDTDYTYITFGRPFYRNGIKAGVVTVDIILPVLQGFFRQYDLSDFAGIFLTTDEGDLVYSDWDPHSPEERYRDDAVSVRGLYEESGRFSRTEVLEWYRDREFKPILLSAVSTGFTFSIHGVIDRRRIIGEMIRTARDRFLMFPVLWVLVLAVYLFYSRFRKQNHRNRELNSENLSLKEEILRRKEAESQLLYLAYHDPVTGLHNLQSFLETVSPPGDRTDQRKLIQISLDNIRELSILLDRSIIDRLLQEFADRLIRNCPEGALLFRGSGFAFFIVCPDEPAGTAGTLAERLLKEFRRTIMLHNREVRLRIRIGLAPFRDASDLDHVLKRAQTTLAREDSRQVNRITLYDRELSGRKSFLLSLDAAMSGSNFTEELHLLYQPIVRTDTRELAGMEALVRWNSTRLSARISPGDFIPLAEENGYIIELGWFVLEEAMKTLTERGQGEDWFVSVNVSPLQFIESGFTEKLDAMTGRYGVDRNRLKLEVIETSAGGGVLFFWQIVDELIRKGYRLAVDDFGTGESSFHRLYSFAFDTLKIDRSFIRDITSKPRNRRIFQYLLSLGEAMENIVVAEGVETEEQHELLRSMGLKYAQGYLYSRPVPLDELLKS